MLQQWPGIQPPAKTGPRVLTRADVAIFWRKYARWMFGSLLLALAAAIVYLIFAPPSYVARSELLIEPLKIQGGGDLGAQAIPVDQGEVESQVEVLRSKKVADDVVRGLGLTSDPEFGPAKASADAADPMRIASEEFAGRLNVRRIGQSYVVEVSFRASNPEKAARIVNAVDDAYLTGGWRFDPRFDRFRRFAEPVEKQALTVSNVHVITPATPPIGKSSPQTKLVLALAVLLGGLVGAGSAMALHSLDRTAQSPAQLKRDVGVECLGALPLFRSKPAKFRGKPAKSNLYGFNSVAQAPYSRFSDAMQSIKTAIDLASLGEDLNSIGIVSSEPLVGKSTVASNLATLYSLAGARPLLLDLNFRNPSLSEVLAPTGKSGLLELVQGKGADGIVYDERIAAFFLPLIGGRRIARALDLFGPGIFKQVVELLQKSYAPIIVDLPSLRAAPDTRAICAALDTNIIVAEWIRTDTQSIREALALFEAANAHLLGTIVNKFKG
jgi:succinoglycan biosynthesis transport protein ExoP